MYNINCRGPFGGWREHGGLLTDKAVLPVTQIRLGDLNDPHEKGYTLGKLKCYGVAERYTTQELPGLENQMPVDSITLPQI